MIFVKRHYAKIILIIIGIYIGASATYWVPKSVDAPAGISSIKVINANGGSEQAGKESVEMLGPKGVKVSPGPDFNKMIENSTIQIK